MTIEDQDVKNPPAPSTGEGAATPSTPPAEGTPSPTAESTPDFKESIVKDLMEGKSPEIPEPTATGEPAETPAAKPEPEAAPAPEAAAEDKPKLEPAAPLPQVHPFDEEDDPKGDIDPKFTKIRGDFEKMREKLRKAREDGNFGKLMASTAAQAKITPEALAKWVDLGARLNTGDPTAVQEFNAMAQHLAKQAGVAPPAQRQAAAPPVSQVDALAEKIYAENFADDVKSYQVTEAMARAKAKTLAEKFALSQSQTPTPPPAAPEAPAKQQFSPVELSAAQAISRLDADYAAKVPEYATKIRPLVQKAIAEKRAKNGQLDAIYWLPDFTSTVAEVRASMATKAPPAPIKPTQPIKAATRGAPPATAFDANRQAIAEALTNGGVGLDDLVPSP